MTATKKLFIAAVLLAAGFGVARLMGRPAASWYAPQMGETALAAERAGPAVKPIGSAFTSEATAHGTRLVPDLSADNPYQVRSDATVENSQRQSQNDSKPGDAPVAPPPLATGNEYQSLLQPVEPRAKLRDEAPRPLDIDSRGLAPAYSQPVPQLQSSEVAATATQPRAAAVDSRASGLTQADFAQESNGVPTISASYMQPFEVSSNAPKVLPPPWPELVQPSEPRTHVVIDGDSLERLAGRYLDDSSRGNEIYQANRELLASPDLLPIGVELVIPKRETRAAFEATSPQSSLASDPSLRAASHHGALRPIPAAANVMPRAQLLSPVPME